jgi:hypothetical protein
MPKHILPPKIQTYEELLLTRPPARLSEADRIEAKRQGYGAVAVVTRVGLNHAVRTFYFPTVKDALGYKVKVESGEGYQEKHFVEIFEV